MFGLIIGVEVEELEEAFERRKEGRGGGTEKKGRFEEENRILIWDFWSLTGKTRAFNQRAVLMSLIGGCS
jgi:hypothetical protein